MKKEKKHRKPSLKVVRSRKVVIDASGLILGRLASYVAKRLLFGEEVIVVNSEKAIISGSKKYITEKFKKKLSTRTLSSQKKAPIHARRPETYVRRVVRGMLPWSKKPTKGKIAYGRLRVYAGLPAALGECSTQTIPKAKKNIMPFMTVGKLMEIFGWNNPLKEITVNIPQTN